jgi:catechol 2,3-dioxygenase-like lactoylglutathione lyase family enzyme
VGDCIEFAHLGEEIPQFATIRTVLHHVSIPVKSAVLEACEAFYAALGFTPVEPPPGVQGRARWVEKGGNQVHLVLDEDAQPLPGPAHLAVVVEDYDAAVARLADLGAADEPRRPHWGSPRAYVRDPAGHRVEIMAWPP